MSSLPYVGMVWVENGSTKVYHIICYVAMERKPDNCIEVQDFADVIRGIIL